MVSKQFHPKIESGLLRLHAGSPYESLSSLSRYGRGKGRGKRGMGERTSERRDGREDRDQNTVQLTHFPTGPAAPFTCGCDVEVSESCDEREMCMWDGARPGLRGRRAGRETG